MEILLWKSILKLFLLFSVTDPGLGISRAVRDNPGLAEGVPFRLEESNLRVADRQRRRADVPSAEAPSRSFFSAPCAEPPRIEGRVQFKTRFVRKVYPSLR